MSFEQLPGQKKFSHPISKNLHPCCTRHGLATLIGAGASAHPEGDPIYMVCGEVTVLMGRIKQPVTITGIEIEGAESLEKFDNFRLDPSQPETRGMKLYFRGKAPEGIDDYTVQLVFKDLRGNRYPTVQHRFKPLPIPERVGIQRGNR